MPLFDNLLTDGMAILHAVFAELTQSVVITTTLEKAVAYDTRNKKPVDIFGKILGPDQADCNHLKLLSAAAKHLEQSHLSGAA